MPLVRHARGKKSGRREPCVTSSSQVNLRNFKALFNDDLRTVQLGRREGVLSAVVSQWGLRLMTMISLLRQEQELKFDYCCIRAVHVTIHLKMLNRGNAGGQPAEDKTSIASVWAGAGS